MSLCLRATQPLLKKRRNVVSSWQHCVQFDRPRFELKFSRPRDKRITTRPTGLLFFKKFYRDWKLDLRLQNFAKNLSHIFAVYSDLFFCNLLLYIVPAGALQK